MQITFILNFFPPHIVHVHVDEQNCLKYTCLYFFLLYSLVFGVPIDTVTETSRDV